MKTRTSRTRSNGFVELFQGAPLYFKIFFTLVLVGIVVCLVLALTGHDGFTEPCTAKGGTVSQEYSYSAGKWLQLCKNADGAIIDIR